MMGGIKKTHIENEEADGFKKGDGVKLKVGGPLMIIDEIIKSSVSNRHDHDHARCVWFDKLKHKMGVFSLHTIEKVSDRS